MQEDMLPDSVINTADERLASALKECGNKCIVDHGRLVTKDVRLGDWTVNVCVRGPQTDEKRANPSLMFRVMLRVNMQSCPTPDLTKHATVERMIDRLLIVQEHALNVLVLTWRKKAAPFFGMVLKTNQVSPTDSWVGHINTSKDGVWRCSHWMVCTPSLVPLTENQQERAAILEYDAGFPREVAESLAEDEEQGSLFDVSQPELSHDRT